jgi:hypothetical protein
VPLGQTGWLQDSRRAWDLGGEGSDRGGGVEHGGVIIALSERPDKVIFPNKVLAKIGK